MFQELKDKGCCFLVDNLDKVIDGELVNFTSIILIVDRSPCDTFSTEVCSNQDFFHSSYLRLNEHDELKYMDAVVHILANKLATISSKYAWLREIIPSKFCHSCSNIADLETFWSYVSLLPLSEQKNADMVEVLDHINEYFLDVLCNTEEHSADVKRLIAVLKSSDSTDEDVARAETHLLNIAKRRGLLLIIGDQLTYERAFISKQLRKGSITSIERFDLLRFRLAMFHLLMAKLRKDYELYMPNMSNVFDRSTMAFIRARLSKHEITNEGDRIKKGKFDLL